MGNVLIKNIRIIDAFTDKIGNVYVENGLITDESKLNENNLVVIEGKGKVLMPSFVDLHVHFREPGFTNKEDISTGSHAAVKGGYTTVVTMANTNPVCSSMEIVNFVRQKANEIGICDVEQVVSITDEMKGQKIEHLKNIDETVKFISDDGKGLMNDKLMEDALKLSENRNFRVISHAEDTSFSETDMRKAENYMTRRDLYACKLSNGKIHMAHVSTKEAVEMIIEAKENGIDVTCEVTPHHIFATDNTIYRVNPPLRKKDDVDTLIQAMKDGYIDTISTDHAPHTEEDKKKGSPGISGIETSFQICFTKLVKENHISLNELSELMSKNPAQIMGINKGLIKYGYEADFVIVDIEKKTKINTNDFVSKGKNTPFNGVEVYGEVLTTIKHGKIVYKAGE